MAIFHAFNKPMLYQTSAICYLQRLLSIEGDEMMLMFYALLLVVEVAVVTC